jgi:hypothetical protein
MSAAQVSVDDLLRQVDRRRRVRMIVVGTTAAAACALLALVVPGVVSGSRSDGGPVDNPTSSAETGTTNKGAWKPADLSSPVDGKTWEASVVSLEGRRAELVGTPLDKYAERVYQRSGLDTHATTGAYFWMGEARVSLPTTHVVGTVSKDGTFETDGHQLVIRLNGMPGSTTFHWSKPAENELKLTFEETSVGPLYGAPAEVFFRMWSVEPFTMRLGY